jgi:hypothetical protein
MDMISRGISFCSTEKTPDAMTANVMIYNPSKNIHNVAIAQRIGRLTGTARPDLQRYLYAPKNVYENYINYNINQKHYIAKLQTQIDNTSSLETMKTIKMLKELTRGLDRKILRLPKFEIQIHNNKTKKVYKTLIDKWLIEDTIIAKIFRFICENPNGVSKMELKDYLTNNTTSTNIDFYINELDRQKYKNIFQRNENHITKLTNSTKEYLSNKN